MRIGKVVLFVCAGAAIAWLASALLGGSDDSSRPVSERVLQAETDSLENPAADSEAFVSLSDPQRNSDVESTDERETPERDFSEMTITVNELTSGDSVVGAVEPAILNQVADSEPQWSSSANSGGPLGERTQNFTRDPKELSQAMLTDLVIRCEFGSGNDGLWSTGNFQHSFVPAYQGGPIVFHSVDIDSGTARVSGSVGATGSLAGEMAVRLDANMTGLHFSWFTITTNGNFLIITIFGAVDASGRYLAVMSRHQDFFCHGGSIFYGTCD